MDDPSPDPAPLTESTMAAPDAADRLSQPPADLASHSAERWRTYHASAQRLLALPEEEFRETIASARQETVPAEVLVFCIRLLEARGAHGKAKDVLAQLFAAEGTGDRRRYLYLGGLRNAAYQQVPSNQASHDGEDLFHQAQLRVLNQLRTNRSALHAWRSFCWGRLKEALADYWGEDCVWYREQERAIGFFPVPSDDAKRSILESEQAGQPIGAGMVEPCLEEVVFGLMEEIVREAEGESRPVLEALWIAPERADKKSLALRLGIPRDRVYNHEHDGLHRLFAKLRSVGHPDIDDELVDVLVSRIPRRRGSKPAKPKKGG